MHARDRLIEATQELLWDRGYTAASPRAILDRAEVGQGSMYYHFAGKETLALTALTANADALTARVETALRGRGSAARRIHAFLSMQREVLRGCPVGRMVSEPDVLESTVLFEVLTRTFQQTRDLLVAVVADGVQRRELRPDIDPAELADTVMAVVQGGYVLARAAGDAKPYHRAVRGARALVRLAEA